MNENVQVINQNGDAMNTEGIAYIELTETGKKYLFYTLDEKVDNNLTKIYIAEVSETAGNANSISDTEWDDLRKKMVRISHKEEVLEIKYLPMGNIVFNIGEPKKLAISDLNKQAFKDAQITHSIAANQTATPVVGGESTFFAAEPVSNDTVHETAGINIFTNPPQPVETNSVNLEPVNEIKPQTEAPVIPAVPVTSVEPVVPVEPVQLVSTEPIGVAGTQKTIITDEEALKAISVIQDYIEQEEAA